MKHAVKLSLLLLAGACTVLSACTNEDEQKSSSGGTNTGGASGKATTQCGVVFEGALQNPVDLRDGMYVSVLDVLGSNLVLVSESGTSADAFIVKLQGLEASLTDFKKQEAMRVIGQMLAGGGVFFKATEDCNLTLLGRPSTIGHLLSRDGRSVNEALITADLAGADSADACRGDLIGACYDGLAEDTVDSTFAQVDACGFLWKPVSDSDGNAVVLFEECGVRLFVNGEEGRNTGSGNSRCSTIRLSKPGCAYGQATLEAYDESTGLPYVFPNGETKLVLGGCQRVEFPCAR